MHIYSLGATGFQTRVERKGRKENYRRVVGVIGYIPLGTWGSSEILYCLFLHPFSFSPNLFFPLSGLKFLSVVSKSSKKDVMSVKSVWMAWTRFKLQLYHIFYLQFSPDDSGKSDFSCLSQKSLLWDHQVWFFTFSHQSLNSLLGLGCPRGHSKRQHSLWMLRWGLRLQGAGFGGIWSTEVSEWCCLKMKHIS